jgi:membrane associated rhomboid family serine protease
MTPVKVTMRSRAYPIITTSFILVNIVIFAMQKLYLTVPESQWLTGSFGLVPSEVSSALYGRFDLLPYNALTVFTSMFLHGGWAHVIGNMVFLGVFGGAVEAALGHGRFFFFYVLSGVAAAAFQFLYDPLSHSPMIGASGAVSGILGATLALFPFARVRFVRLPAVLLLTIWFAIQVAFSYGEGAAWFAHIGGFIFGLVTARLFRLGRPRR